MKRCSFVRRLVAAMVAVFAFASTGALAQANLGLYGVATNSTTIGSGDLANQVHGPGVDDAVSSTINLPFTFWYNGAPYDRVRVSSNGWVAFGNSSNSPVFPANMGSVPSNDPEAWQFATNPMAAVLWDDLQVGTNGLVSYSSNSSEFKIRWRDMEWGTSNIFITFELTLRSDGSCPVRNQMLFSYGTGSNNANQTATVGILNSSTAAAPNNYLVFDGSMNLANLSNDAGSDPGTRLISYNGISNGASMQFTQYDALYVEEDPNLDFGLVNANGGIETRSIDVRNVGCNNVTVNNTHMSSNNGQFTIPTFSSTVVPNAVVSLDINFTGTCPADPLPITGSVTLSTPVPAVFPGAQDYIGVVAEEIHPSISVSAIAAFGDVALGASHTEVVTLTNSGSEDYTGSLSISGTGSSQFDIDPTPVTVPAGGTADVDITFTPDAATHAANANSTTWIATYSVTLTIPEGNQGCNGGVLATLPLSANSVAPRVAISVNASTSFVGNQTEPLLDMGRKEYQPSLADVNTPQDYVADFQVSNTGSSALTIDDITNALSGNLNDRFSASAVLVSGGATLAPGQAAAYRVTYQPQTASGDYPTTQGVTNGVQPAEINAATSFQLAINGSTPVGGAGYWTAANGTNLTNEGQVDLRIGIFRGTMRTMLAQANSSQQAPTDPNGAPTLNGGLSVPGTANVNVGNGTNGTQRMSVESFWGNVGDVLPNGGLITQAGQPGITSFYVVNNGNANARYWVRKDLVNDNVNPGAFSLSVPIVGSNTIIVSDDNINGVDYHTFTLEPLYPQGGGNSEAFVRFDVTFAPNASNTLDVTTIADTRSADIEILTDANLPFGNSDAPRNATPYIISVDGNSMFNDPAIYVNAGTADEATMDGGADFGTHELANRISSDYPFGAYAPAGIGYSAPAEELVRRGLSVGANGPAALGVRDTVIMFVVRNHGNADMVFNNMSDLQAFAISTGSGSFNVVRVTSQSEINSAGAGAPSNASFPYALSPYSSNGDEIIMWVQYDAGSRFSGNIGQAVGTIRAVQSTLSTQEPHVVSISYNNSMTGNGIRPFPIVNTNGGNNGTLGIIDGPTRTAPLYAADRPAIFDNYCFLGGLDANRDQVAIPVTIGNGNPSPIAVGNQNDNEVSNVTFDFNAISVDSIDGNLYVYDPSHSFYVDYNQPVQIRNSFGTVVDTRDISDVANRMITLSAGQTATFTVQFRPAALMPPSVGTLRASVRIPHNARNNSMDFSVETGASQTNASSENGDVYKYMEIAVEGTSLRPAIRLEHGNVASSGTLGDPIVANSTLDNFNLPYNFMPGVFAGDSSFVPFTLRNTQETGTSNTGADFSTGMIGIKSISIEGVDFPDFEIVGFKLPVGTIEPNMNVWPVSMGANALATGKQFIQWTVDVPGVGEIGTPYALDRNQMDMEAVSLYIHFKPRRMVSGDYKETRNAVLRIVTTDLCQPELVYNITGKVLHADLAFDMEQLDFGNVQVNDVAQRTLTVTNSGNFPAHFKGEAVWVPGTPMYSHNFVECYDKLGIEWFSTNPPHNFSVVSPILTPINPGDSREFYVQFAPSEVGRKDATLSMTYIPEVIPTIANGNVRQLEVTGRGVAPVELTLNPRNGILNFGNVFIGSSETMGVTLTNDGDAAVTLVMDPAMVGVFSYSHAASTVLQPGESTTVNVTFGPLALGEQQISIMVEVPDAFGSPSYEIVALGNGVSATALSTNSIDYGVQRVFTEIAEAIYVNNGGGINSVNVVFQGFTGVNASEFSLRMNGNIVNAGYNFTVDAGYMSDMFDIVFSPNTLPNNPSDENLASAQANFYIDGVMHSVRLSGEGAVPQLEFAGREVQNGEIDFGTIALGESAERSIEVQNVGRFPLEISQLLVVGANSNDFQVTNQATVLEAGDAITVTLTMVPGSETTGTLNARLTAVSNSLNARSVELYGSRAVPMLTLSSSNMYFGQIRVGQDADRSLVVGNATTQPLTINSFDIDGAGHGSFSVAGTSKQLPATLEVGEEMMFSLNFQPGQEGDKVARMTIETNEGQSTVELYGRAYVPGIAHDRQSLNFGSMPLGTTRTQKVTVTNTGIEEVIITDAKISGQDALMFAADINTGVVLQPQESRQISVEFTPLTNGLKYASLDLETSVDTEINVVLFGVGGAAAISTVNEVDFGLVQPNMYIEHELTVNNNGDAPLEITEAILSGANAGDFEVVAGLPIVVASQTFTKITVRFTPGEVGGGTRTALLSLVNNTGTPAEVSLKGETTITDVTGDAELVEASINETFPNPFADVATVRYTLDTDTHVTLTVYNEQGVQVATIADEFKGAGEHIAEFTAGTLASGVYVVRLQAGSTTATTTMTLVK